MQGLMQRVAIIAAVLVVAATCASADYVSFYTVDDLGSGYYQYHYEYHNPGGAADLIAGSTTWTLEDIIGLDYPFADAAGAVYWDSGTFVNDNTGVTWTYLGTESGEPDDAGQETYSLFQVIVYHPGGATSDVPYEITTPNESGEVRGPTPEPATLSLCLLGLGALVARRRSAR